MGKLASNWKQTYDFAMLEYGKARTDKSQQADELMGLDHARFPLPWKGELGKVLDLVEKNKSKPATLKQAKEAAALIIQKYRGDIQTNLEDLGGKDCKAVKMLNLGLQNATNSLNEMQVDEAFEWEVGLHGVWKDAKKKSEKQHGDELKAMKKDPAAQKKAKEAGVDKYPAKFEKLKLGPSLDDVDSAANKKDPVKARQYAEQIKTALASYTKVVEEAESSLEDGGFSDDVIKPLKEALARIEHALEKAGI